MSQQSSVVPKGQLVRTRCFKWPNQTALVKAGTLDWQGKEKEDA
jgi:hypothetical protein